jgi:hypothetical protein
MELYGIFGAPRRANKRKVDRSEHQLSDTDVQSIFSNANHTNNEAVLVVSVVESRAREVCISRMSNRNVHNKFSPSISY